MNGLSTVEFVSYLRSLNIRLSTDGQRLRFNAPAGVMTPALQSELAERKSELIEFLGEAVRSGQPQSSAIERTPRDVDPPLSFGQLRLWLLDQLEPGGITYNVPALFRLSGDLNLAVLEQSFGEIVRRHESLRTSFVSVDGAPVQKIHPPKTFTIPVVDLEAIPEPAKQSEITLRAFLDATQPFDLSEGPVLRAKLCRLSPTEHVLLLNVHHIAFDGWSSGIFVRELSALYRAFLAGESSPLPELPIQYADFAVWQQQRMQGELLQELLDYWKAKLAGPLPVLELPTDYPRPKVQTYNGGNVAFTLSRKLTDALQLLSEREGVTLFVTLLAALQMLLQRYTGQEDSLVGTPIANRNRPEIEDMIGFFVNTLVMRTDLSGDPTFRELLRRVQQTAHGAYAHQDLPFEKLVLELNPERDPSRTPIVQVMFVLLNVPMEVLDLPGVAPTRIEFHNGGAKFDLSLYLEEVEEGLSGWFSYNTDLFAETTVERMIQHFTTLLEGIVADPGQRLHSFPLLTEAQREQMLSEWNNTQRDYPRDQTIHDLFEIQVERTPDAVALVFENHRLTFRELNDRANQWAHYLRKSGVGPETLVGVCVERSIDMMVALLAVLKAGGAYVPLDPSYPAERLQFILEDAQVSLLLTERTAGAKLRDVGTRIVWMNESATAIAAEPKINPAAAVHAENLAYAIYTSGSTGQPKGVLATHRNAVNRFSWMWRTYPFAAGEVCCQKTSLSFVDSVWEIFGPLLQGIRVVIIPDLVVKDPLQLVETLAVERVTRIVVVPSLLRTILEGSSRLDKKLSKLKMWVCSGEALDSDLVRRFRESIPDGLLLNLYGSSEVAADVTCYEFRGGAAPGVVPIGRPIDNTQIYLLDKRLQPVPIGVRGEIYVGGDGLARGYLRRSELTAEKFILNPHDPARLQKLYRTGDLGRYRADGNIEYLGRLDHQVKLRGFRIELDEIRANLKSHPVVSDALVMVRGTAGDERLAAYVALKPGRANPGVKELRDFLKARLPYYMLPASLVALDALPLTPNGKLDRVALEQLDQNRPETGERFTAPRDDWEQRLAGVWEKFLNVSPIGVRDNYFDLGGHSVLAVRIFAEIKKVFGVSLPLSTLFQAPTVEQMASLLREREGSANGTSPIPIRSASSLVLIQRGTDPRPLYFVHGIGGTLLRFNNFVRQLGPDETVYGLQSQGVDGDEPLLTRVEEMAARYIRDIRKVHPGGPYCLAGYSFGGLVAFEMAQQLLEAGEEVALLVLFDTVQLRYKKNLANPLLSANMLYRYTLKIAQIMSESEWTLIWDRMQGLFWRLVYKLGRARWHSLPRRLGMVHECNRLAYITYIPKVYHGRLTLFRSSERTIVDRYDYYLGWSGLASDGIEVHEVPGNHGTLAEEPNVGVVTRTLRMCLEKARAREEIARNSVES